MWMLHGNDSYVANNDVKSRLIQSIVSKRKNFLDDPVDKHNVLSHVPNTAKISLIHVWCNVPTLIPSNIQSIVNIMQTWGRFCDKIVFVVASDEINELLSKINPNELKIYKFDELNVYNAQMIVMSLGTLVQHSSNHANSIAIKNYDSQKFSKVSVTFLTFSLQYTQSSDHRNIWEKMWKTWYFIGKNINQAKKTNLESQLQSQSQSQNIDIGIGIGDIKHLISNMNDDESDNVKSSKNHNNDDDEKIDWLYYDWFLKIDDDTFYSGINFKLTLAQYLNDPRITNYYLGHTLLHKWERDNVIFNSGTCYALSQYTLLNLYLSNIFVSKEFLYPASWIKDNFGMYCSDRPGALEDQSIAICLRSIGINPYNTLDNNYLQRFHIFRETDMEKIIHEDTWFWQNKPKQIGYKGYKSCCNKNSISYHAYKLKHGDQYKWFKLLNEKYNTISFDAIELNNKQFEPIDRRMKDIFKYDENTTSHLTIDEYRNKIPPPKGQFIWKGDKQGRTCWECKDIKYNLPLDI